MEKEEDPLVVSKADQFNDILTKESSTVQLLDGSAFVIGNDKKIVFILKIKTTKNKNIFGFIDLETSKTLTVSYVDSTGECDPQFFPWGEKIIMVLTQCEQTSSNQKIKQFIYADKNFVGNNELVFPTADYLKDKDNFTTIKVSGTEVLLFTKQTTEKGPGKIDFWMTDGSRIKNLETIMPQFTGAFYGFTLHKNNQLFALYQKNGEPEECEQEELKCDKIYVISLNKQFEEIKKALEAWNTIKNNLKKFCENRSVTVIPCSTNGLVGFLSDKGNDNIKDKIWQDEYEYINAKVNGGKKVNNGFQFDGPEAGAEWILKKENQPYDFATTGFTLVATVMVDTSQKKEDFRPLIGVKTSKSTKSVGVWCSKEDMFVVKQNTEVANEAPNKTCVIKKEYQMAFVYSNNKISVYADWERLGEDHNFEIKKTPQEQLTFYFGCDGTENNIDKNVTVTNVLLYNRPFSDSEIENLKKHVKPDKVVTPPNDDKATTAQEEDVVPTPLPQGTDKNEKRDEKEKKAPSPSRTEDGGVGGGVRVFSLLLAVLCVSAPLLHL